MPRAFFLLLASGALLSLGCSDRDDPPPGGGMDAGTRDSSTGDAAPPSDAPPLDAPATPDAPPADTGPVDARTPTDAPLTRDAAECPPECFRAFECAVDCMSEPFMVGCCPCPPGTVDIPIDCRGGPRREGETCGGAIGECGAGLSCCYPCGIPDCENICEPTCDPGSPGCLGGCLLRA